MLLLSVTTMVPVTATGTAPGNQPGQHDINGGTGAPHMQPIWFPARLRHYWRAMCTRSSASGSSISFPLTSTVTLWMVPVNLNVLA